jgi:hypothetical protein
MKQRLLTGWSFIRVIYLLAGLMMLIQSLTDRQWMLAPLGLYFAVMGLFAIGCAGGSCYAPPVSKNKNDIIDTKFEEVK